MSYNCRLGEGIGLRAILVSGWFVGHAFYELICEYFDIGSMIVKRIGGLLWRSYGSEYRSGLCIVVGIVLFADDDGGVGVASEDSFVPHEVVVDEFAGLGGGTFSLIIAIRVIICICLLVLPPWEQRRSLRTFNFITYTEINQHKAKSNHIYKIKVKMIGFIKMIQNI